MTVVTNKEWNKFRDMDIPAALGEISKFVLLKYLMKYVPDDFVKMPWRVGLSQAYAQKKVGAIGFGRVSEGKYKNKKLRKMTAKQREKFIREYGYEEYLSEARFRKEYGVGNYTIRSATVIGGGSGVDDLILTGALYTELASNAPKAVKVEEGVAFVILDQSKVPYMAAHQYGYSPKKLPSRRYIRIVEHEADLVGELRRKLISLMMGIKVEEK